MIKIHKTISNRLVLVFSPPTSWREKNWLEFSSSETLRILIDLGHKATSCFWAKDFKWSWPSSGSSEKPKNAFVMGKSKCAFAVWVFVASGGPNFNLYHLEMMLCGPSLSTLEEIRGPKVIGVRGVICQWFELLPSLRKMMLPTSQHFHTGVISQSICHPWPRRRSCSLPFPPFSVKHCPQSNPYWKRNSKGWVKIIQQLFWKWLVYFKSDELLKFVKHESLLKK